MKTGSNQNPEKKQDLYHNEPRIEKLTALYLVGMHCEMSLANNKTRELWKSFMPNKGQLKNPDPGLLYSVDVYPRGYFDRFDPERYFVKWAAVKAAPESSIPGSMEALHIPGGNYAIFRYRGLPEDVAGYYRYIFSEWLPGSAYCLDHRPHLCIMGKEYQNGDPLSEEDIYIPIAPK